MIKNTLKILGLSNKEIRIYLSILNNNPIKTSQIAREVGIPPQSINSILSKLTENGFIEQGNISGVKQYFADYRDLFTLIDKRSQSFSKERKNLEEEMSKYLKLTNPKNNPRTTYHEGYEGLKRVFEGMLEYWKSGAEKQFRAYGIRKFPKELEGFLINWIKERHTLGVTSRVIIGKGPKEYTISGKMNEYGRTVKKIDIDPERAAIYIAGDRIYTFSFENKIGVTIEEPAIAELLKNVFDNHWKHIKGKK